MGLNKKIGVVTLLLAVNLGALYANTETHIADTVTLRTIDVIDKKMGGFLISRMDDVGNGVINAAKKTEVVELRRLTVATANNSARQIFASVAGLNIWESDVLGLQLGIGGRGLSPDRSSNFTIRQNGYDIAADPLGYPESYYTPPMDLVDRIEVTRGGAALRYGTQFGGVVNFVTNEPAFGEPMQARAYLGGGSYGLAVGSVGVSGTTSSLRYSGYYQYRTSDGWRQNSAADQHTAYASLGVQVNSSVRLSVDVTHMNYLAQQPGGLSDRMFVDDFTQSIRPRNWFSVDWNVASVKFDVLLDTLTTLRSIFSGMLSSRTALGDLNRITMADLGGQRTMIDGHFANLCNETTVTRDVHLFGATSSITGGFRVFTGRTIQQQGNGSASSAADFSFLHPDSLEGSDYTFPNTDVAVFSEAALRLGGGFSLVPGIRVEHIRTQANGWYRILVNDLAGNHVVDSAVHESRRRDRTIALAGLGMSWKPSTILELYTNVVQNYRAITFTDLRVVNPNLVVDPNIQDERGYTLDLGVRGTIPDLIAFDASVFYLRYSNKIGEILRTDLPPLYLPYRYRTNISDAYTAGVEAVADLNITGLVGLDDKTHDAPEVHCFVNGSVMDGRYVSSEYAAIEGRRVEFVPTYTVRTGLHISLQQWSLMLVQSMVGNQYSDATNSQFTASAVTGLIPSYSVLDVTMGYKNSWCTIRASVNNVLDAHYFTRRAVSYPGPGIIPSDPWTIVLSCALQWSANSNRTNNTYQAR